MTTPLDTRGTTVRLLAGLVALAAGAAAVVVAALLIVRTIA
jgi:hypothetical protein